MIGKPLGLDKASAHRRNAGRARHVAMPRPWTGTRTFHAAQDASPGPQFSLLNPDAAVVIRFVGAGMMPAPRRARCFRGNRRKPMRCDSLGPVGVEQRSRSSNTIAKAPCCARGGRCPCAFVGTAGAFAQGIYVGLVRVIMYASLKLLLMRPDIREKLETHQTEHAILNIRQGSDA